MRAWRSAVVGTVAGVATGSLMALVFLRATLPHWQVERNGQPQQLFPAAAAAGRGPGPGPEAAPSPNNAALSSTARSICCPAGAYLTKSERAIRNSKLTDYYRRLTNDSQFFTLKIKPLETIRTRESLRWPKPKRCRALERSFQNLHSQGVGDIGSLRVVRAHNWIWGFAFKAGATISNRLILNTPEECSSMRGRRTYFRSIPRLQVKRLEHVFLTRNPVKRFVSAFQEVLVRQMCRFCNTGPEMYEPCYEHDNLSPASQCRRALPTNSQNCTHPSMDPGPLLKAAFPVSKFNANGDHSGALGAADLRALVDGFLVEVECKFSTDEIYHGFSAMSFLHPRQRVDVLLRLEHFADEMRDKLHIEDTCVDYVRNTHLRTSSDKPLWTPHSQPLLDLLNNDTTLMRRLCHLYIQDYICFDYDLPDACKDMVH